jgi:HEAT repeat protein
MKACFVAAAIVALAAQKDANAAAAGLASADPSVRTHAACELRAFGGQAAPFMPRLVAMLDDASPVDPAVCGERTWRARGSRDATTPGEQAASVLVAIGAPSQPVLLKALGGPAWVARRNAAWALGAIGG